MGNTITQAIGLSQGSCDEKRAAYRMNSDIPHARDPTKRQSFDPCYFSKETEVEYELKSKTLPARHTHANNKAKDQSDAPPPNGQTSRVLFLLYLIHRTWNVVVDTMDTRGKKSRRARRNSDDSIMMSKQPGVSHIDTSISITDIDDLDSSSFCCSQYSMCTCSYCYTTRQQNVYNSIADDCSADSICDSNDFSPFYHGYPMAPSVCQSSPKLPPHCVVTCSVASSGQNGLTNTRMICSGNEVNAIGGRISIASHSQTSNFGGSLNGSLASYKMSSENSWPQAAFNKENQRPPVYNPEDYAQSLKKFSKRQSGQNARSIYDANDAIETTEDNIKSATLPTKHSEYKSPIPAPVKSDSEMSLRQFSSITDLLTKLRADLRVSFPSFVQEFVATPSDGISLLLEVLRAIQLSQATNSPFAVGQTVSMPRNSQSYQRRALLDELACLQCLSICCSRSLEATARLGTTPVGLMPLASSATGQGIRARILALQLMTGACDKSLFGHGSQKIVTAGHTAVSEAMSTLRLRCSEPVRFRLLVGMLNSGGGSGELQAIGVRFINTFLESAQNLQQRLYLQAELFQAGFEPSLLAKTISSSSPWLDSLRNEIKRFNDIYVDIDKMIVQARDAERVRSQMVILERRVQILHEEKSVLTSMERRLQERCAELQREIFRLQGAQNGNNTFKSLDKQPVALPRQAQTAQNKLDNSEHEDEGISSSETGPSLSPVPILVLPSKHKSKSLCSKGQQEDADIENVMEQLDQVVNEAEKQLYSQPENECPKEQEIVPVNIVPQPPRKSRSLTHLVSHAAGSELDGSEYGLLLLPNANENLLPPLRTFFDEIDYELHDSDKPYVLDVEEVPEMNNNSNNNSTTRELLDVIMNARHTEDDPTIKALRENSHNDNSNIKLNPLATDTDLPNSSMPKRHQAPAQHFNGVFFMTGMNTPQKYPKPDLTAALQARRVTKNIERLEAAFANPTQSAGGGGGDTNILREKSRSNQQIYFGSNPTLRTNNCSNSNSTNNNNNNGNNSNVKTTNQQLSTRTRTQPQGGKVTDIPSGLY